MEQRRFTLLDGMVLVAATAVGLALVRLVMRSYLGNFMRPQGTWILLLAVARGLMIAAPCAVSLSLALLVLRFVKPRPLRRRAFRQPGAVAILAGAVCPLTAAWPVLPLVRYLGATHRMIEGEVLAIIAVLQCGAAVVVAWSVLALVGCRHARRDWIERAGIALGVYWIATNLSTCVMIVGGWL